VSEIEDLINGLKELDKARAAYSLAWKMYDGTAREVFASPYIQNNIQASADKYRVNVARKPVTAVLNRLKLNSVTVVDGEALQDTLTTISEDNDLDVELPDFFEKVEVYGDSYLLVWPNENATPTETNTVDAVDIFVHKPLDMRAIYDTENPRKIAYVIPRWITVSPFGKDATTGKPLATAYDEALFKPFTEQEEDDQGVVTGDGPVITHPWGLPIYHGRTARPYGRPEHYDAFGPQNIITKLVASQLSTVDWYAFPFRYALSKAGTTGANLNDWGTQGRQAPNEHAAGSVTPTNRLSAKPGTLTKLHDTDTVGQLEATPSANFTDPIGLYIRLLSMITDTPMEMQAGGAVESGESRRAKLDGLLSKVEARQAALRGPLKDAFEKALEMYGEPGRVVSISWKPAQKISDTEGWQAVKAKEDAGVPIKIALIEAGYLPEEIDEWAIHLETKLDILERISEVATALGQAVQLMGMEPSMATDLFGRYIAEAVTGDSSNAA
jgi:hypothetical protein